ncbi:MAG TPA: MgtC/SapB family protein [Xanthobacteraceae bacterium]|jgi:putative Mg2+ transporter-C (MgtC) family protein
MDALDIALRLIVAVLIGVALGLNRDLHGRPTGVRTLGIVGLGSALVVLAVGGSDSAATSRVIQGIVTGIGFIGAGVIVRRGGHGEQVQGLTTAACVWLTACAGAASAVADWIVILLSIPLIALVLTFGGALEQAFHRFWPGQRMDDPGS